MGKQAKFSQCEREFVCQHEMAGDCEPIFNLSNTYLMEEMERASFQNFIIELHLNFFKGVRGRKVPLLVPSQDESAI